MKVGTVLIIVLVSTFFSFSQEKPQQVKSLAKEQHSFEWYTHQYSLWKDEIKKDKQNEEAWINLYTAARNAKYFTEDQKTKETWAEKEANVLTDMRKAIKGTFAYYRILSWNGSVLNIGDKEEQERSVNYALKAYELDPTAVEMYPILMNIYEVLNNDKEKLKEISLRWKAAEDHTPNLKSLSYNALMNTKKNSILITGGDNDTYPLWVAQHADQFRQDVHVWNIFLMTIPEYRNRIFSEMGIPKLEGENIEKSVIIEHIAKHKGEHLLYFFNKGIIAKDSTLYEKLYHVGLVYQYSEESFDNSALTVHHFENKFLLDHVKYDFYQSKYPSMDERHNYSYLPGLITLYQHYELIGNESKKRETKEIILRLAKNSPYLMEIKKELNLD
jgi:hypothetical protein